MDAARGLRWLLRLTAISLLAAVVGVVLPFGAMQAAHRRLGLGELPRLPVIDYLARSTSAFYVLLGVIAWLLAGDPRRYRPLLLCLGVAAMLGGIGVTAVDQLAGLPTWWTWTEGPLTLLLGAAVWTLARRLPA